ncbi:MAG: DUF2871 family protein [Nocardioides sp.]
MQTLLFRLAATWTILGLASGLGYRELTRSHDFDGRTQLAVAHTHALVLGTVMMLVLLVLDRVYDLASERGAVAGVWIYNAGVLVTVTMLVVNGSRQVLGTEEVPAALAGISGTGHMTISLGLILLFLALGGAVRREATGSDVPQAGGSAAEVSSAS